MGLAEKTRGTKLHEHGQPVVELELVLKGSVMMSLGDHSVRLLQGSIIGVAEKPGEFYRYDYTVEADAVLYSYAFNEIDDMEKVLHVNQKIAPALTSQTVNNAMALYTMFIKAQNEAKAAYEKMRSDEKIYPHLCQETGTKMKDFSDLRELTPPVEQAVDHWRVAYIKLLQDNEEKFQTGLYTLGSPMCTGIVMTASDLMDQVGRVAMSLREYTDNFTKKTTSFKLAMDSLRAKQKGLGDGNTGDAPPQHLLEHLIDFAGVDDELAGKLREQLKEYKRFNDRSDTSDELRSLRRKLTESYLRLYKAVFMAAVNLDEVPIEAKLFLMFGALDESIIETKDYVVLFRYAKAYQPDPNGRIVTAYEWLKLIYEMVVDPSRNEFDLDWPGYLKDAKMSGDITEAQAKSLMNDKNARLDFELKNMFAMGNRMTFGRISSYVPVFDSCNVLMPMDKAYVSRLKVEECMDRIRKIDVNIFYRERTFSNPRIGINAMPVHEEVLPYIILMPNFGSRSMLWQEVEGKKRNSPGRMLFPIFTTEELSDSMTRVCGEFRWEMCKTEQGIHWNDLSDPSLTSEYSDYLQYYRKNSGLNKDHKEKIKRDLQKYSNNYRRVFVGDYYIYITYESKSALRLNKVSREIIFRYCPFGKETRDGLASNPQYTEHINRHNSRATQKAHPIQMLLKKMENTGDEPPEDLIKEVDFLYR